MGGRLRVQSMPPWWVPGTQYPERVTPQLCLGSQMRCQHCCTIRRWRCLCSLLHPNHVHQKPRFCFPPVLQEPLSSTLQVLWEPSSHDYPCHLQMATVRVDLGTLICIAQCHASGYPNHQCHCPDLPILARFGLRLLPSGELNWTLDTVLASPGRVQLCPLQDFDMGVGNSGAYVSTPAGCYNAVPPSPPRSPLAKQADSA